jgi:hypothetical protein
LASRYRVGTRRVGTKEFRLDIRLTEVTTPRGTFPKVVIRYAESGILYAEVPLGELPEDIQKLFIKEGEK